MASLPGRAEICGEQLNYPAPICTKPPGHLGSHETEIIPAPLSGVAARMLAETDSLERERAAVQWERDNARIIIAHESRRNRVLGLVLIILISANVLVIAVTVALHF